MDNLIFLILCCIVVVIEGIMIKKDCPLDERHRSCSFTEEYTCWTSRARFERVKTSPPRLAHCMSGCFCKKGYVREFPYGGCIQAVTCRDEFMKSMFNNLPSKPIVPFS